MSPVPVLVRRAAALGLVLGLVMPGVAVADMVVADGDAVTTGSQGTLHLGEVTPGATVPVEVAFRLTCKGSSHVAAGSAIAVTVTDQAWPEDGSATATAGGIDVPADWPAPGEACPDYGLPTTLGATPAHLELTAPTILGTAFEFTFLFAADPGDGVTNTIAFTTTLDVVAPRSAPPSDATPPFIAGLPDDLVVFTSGDSAVVTWTAPTATDDTDPDPTVACDPSSGSTFALGTTTVMCTATDVAGNAAQGSFQVTVRQLVAAWGRPLDPGKLPSLTGRLGRTVPLRLRVLAGGVVQGPAGLAAPRLRLERLATCASNAAVVDTRSGGSFHWDDAAWHRNLRTQALGAGCWRLVALVDDSPLAVAVIRLVGEARRR